MENILGIGTNRGHSMIGVGIGLGLAEFRLAPTSFFLPTQFSGLQLWFDANDSATLYQSSGGSLAASDGDPVGQWQDKSGNSRHMVQTDGTKKPTLKLNIQNGKRVVRGDGVNDWLQASFTAISQPTSYFLVIKNQSGWVFDGNAGSSRQGLSESGGQYFMYAGAGYTIGTITAGSKIIEMQFNGANSKFFVNGSQVGATGNAGTNSAANLALFNSPANGYNLPNGGDIAEFIMYNSLLSSQNSASVMAYLNSKWGVF